MTANMNVHTITLLVKTEGLVVSMNVHILLNNYRNVMINLSELNYNRVPLLSW